MSNVNTSVGLYNIPTKFISTTTALQVFTVPAAGSSTSYAGYPSPTLPVGSALSIGLSDIDGSQAWDGRPFKIKVAGIALGIATSTLTLTLNQITGAQVGQIGAAAPVTSTGVQGTGLTAVATLFSALTLGALTVQFYSEILCLWNSTSDRVATAQFSVSALSNASILPSPPVWASAAGIAVTQVTDLNFMLSASINTAADATTYVKLNEFSIERV